MKIRKLFSKKREEREIKERLKRLNNCVSLIDAIDSQTKSNHYRCAEINILYLADEIASMLESTRKLDETDNFSRKFYRYLLRDVVPELTSNLSNAMEASYRSN